MQKATALLLLALSPLATSVSAGESDLQPRIESSRAAIQDFFAGLRDELERAMKSGGPVAAINICHRVAIPITEAKSLEHNMLLSRTSLKLRNPANAPDAWEQAVLEQFAERHAAGEAVTALSHGEMVDIGGRTQFRYLHAIPTAEVCLSCHGSNLDAAVQTKLDELYPEDQAIGYQVGDLRGAFSVIHER